jgi:hypothetical protein
VTVHAADGDGAFMRDGSVGALVLRRAMAHTSGTCVATAGFATNGGAVAGEYGESLLETRTEAHAMLPVPVAARDILAEARNTLARAQQFNLGARARLLEAVTFKDGAHARVREIKGALKEIRRHAAWR